MRVLFADDQIPDEDIPDHEIYDVLRARYPKAQDGFIRAFPLMRRVVRSVAENNDVTVAMRYQDALALAREEHFDVAIIDLGWYADKAVRQADRPVAGWKIAAAIDEADAEDPERPATAQIIYSARFGSNPELGQIAANKGKLPFFKPYREPFTIPLESEAQVEEAADEVASAIQSLRAAVSFIEHLSASGRGNEETLYRDLDVMRKTAKRRAIAGDRAGEAMGPDDTDPRDARNRHSPDRRARVTVSWCA